MKLLLHRPFLSILSISLTAAFHSNNIIAIYNNQASKNNPKNHFKIVCNAQPQKQQQIHDDVVDVSTSEVIKEEDDDDEYSSKTTTASLALKETDEEIYKLIKLESDRQNDGLELIASENFASKAVREALGSRLTNKYSEGMIGKRYYGGNVYIDQIEALCISRALQLYNLSPSEWGVNVQPYSGSPANFAVYTALLKPHDRIMGLDLPSGGHLTHGYVTPRGKRISAASVYFESMPYVLNKETGLIDYDDLLYRAKMFQPKLLIAGASAYPREWDYKRMREIADEVNAILMTDMAHISGLIAADVSSSPFKYSDVVTTTTHKTLRGPRSGMIFAKLEYMDKINTAVFPMLQGGPHNHQIGAVAIALKEAMHPSFKTYAQNVVKNAKTLAQALVDKDHVIVTGGTDNHIILWNVRTPWNLTGFMVERVLERISITTNKNSILGDVSAINPGGVRLGTPALTTRGFTTTDFEKVAIFLHDGCMLAVSIKNIAQENKKEENDKSNTNSKVTMKEFMLVLEQDDDIITQVEEMRKNVESFAKCFDLP